jgi:hypothetical protein
MLKSASVLAATAAAALLALAGQANAAPVPGTFSPTSLSNINLSGTLNLQQTTTADCVTSLNANITSATTGNVSSGSFSGGTWVCGILVAPSGFPWGLAPYHDAVTGKDYIKVTGISATSIAGTCSGDVFGEWSDTAQTITFTGATIPGSPNACVINGFLTANKTVIVNP